MIVSLDRREIPAPPKAGSVVSVGVFDGVHLGHQAILRENIRCAQVSARQSAVVTFHRHPKSVLLGRSPRTLTSLEHRLELFRRAGIEHTVALNFDAELRDVPAAVFAREFLVEGLGARKFVLGFDSKFGRDREGTPDFLRSLGLDVVVVPEVSLQGRAVSSTAIREAVELGDLAGAARMLGRPVTVYGDVVHGDSRGHEIGFPTANLDLHHELHPPPGVYACIARRFSPSGERTVIATHDAVANIGVRPTITDAPVIAPRVEVHVLDFDTSIYGEFLEVEFVARLRDERRFPSLAELKSQIAADVRAAKAILANAR